MNFSWIIEGKLMVSSLPESIKMLSFVKDAGIRAIVSLAPIPIPEEEIERLGFEHLNLFVEDYYPPSLVQLKQFVYWSRFMIKADQPIMIHCEAGIDRSTTLCACYLVMHNDMTAIQAINEIREIRGDDCMKFDRLENFVQECEYVKPLLCDMDDQAFFNSKLIVDMLRRRCPWDKEQSPETMMPNLLEEVYETWEALLSKNFDEIASELGDVLLQLLMISRMLNETADFDLNRVINAMTTKLIKRHPHVFADSTTSTPASVLKQWNDLKDEKIGSIKDLPTTLPPLGRAERMMAFAKNLGFDWPNLSDVLIKMDEELVEFKEAIDLGDKKHIEEELGDVFFVMLNVARFLDVNPEIALKSTLDKFVQRFSLVEDRAAKQKISIRDMTLTEMDAIWNEAKNNK